MSRIDRRSFGKGVAASAAGLLLPGRTPAFRVARPTCAAVMSGDATATTAVVWGRSDRPAAMAVQWSTREDFRDPRTVAGPAATQEHGLCAKVVLRDLPSGAPVFYRVSFGDGHATEGRLRTAPADGVATDGEAGRPVTFAWSGDTAGQGYGIDTARGGMRTYATVLAEDPDFFVHCGDTVYADGPIPDTLELPDGSLWRNLPLEGVHKVAETQAEFHARFRYNLLDEHCRRFHARVPLLVQWDDHETVNNWYPGETLDDPRYAVRDVDVLAVRARKAFFDSMPVAGAGPRGGRIYRQVSHGPLLDLFLLDMRTHRGPNTANAEPEATAILGRAQLDWLKGALAASAATWKVVCSDMPLGLVVVDGDACEAVAQGDGGPPLGREHEIAELLAHLKRTGTRDVVWLTADVHYAASHHYAPERAAFTDFEPFWEFVSGPMHAGTFGPGALDGTFGPEAVWRSREPGSPGNLSPAAGEQHFGVVRIDPGGAMTVRHVNVAGTTLWTRQLIPA